MRATIVPIGNSKGIRIPKKILEECQIEKEVFLEVKNKSIIIKPVKTEPRKDWETSFKKMRELNDDRL
ncbi:MAG: AbrB/MazE/SpoVT family DNA-binding domain-containing protein, partial [Candidatus Eremiobacterota bacterium]